MDVHEWYDHFPSVLLNVGDFELVRSVNVWMSQNEERNSKKITNWEWELESFRIIGNKMGKIRMMNWYNQSIIWMFYIRFEKLISFFFCFLSLFFNQILNAWFTNHFYSQALSSLDSAPTDYRKMIEELKILPVYVFGLFVVSDSKKINSKIEMIFKNNICI